MDSDDRFWISVWAIIAITIILITSILSVYNYKVEHRMTEMGYQKVTVMGSSQALYQKVKDEE